MRLVTYEMAGAEYVGVMDRVGDGIVPAAQFGFEASDMNEFIRQLDDRWLEAIKTMTANDLRDCAGGSASVLVVAKPQYLELCRGEDIFKLAVPVRKSELTGTVGMGFGLASRSEESSRRVWKSPSQSVRIA